MQQYLDQIYRELKHRNYSPRTIEIYSSCIRYFLSYISSDVNSITREKIVDFILHLQNRGKAPKTLNLYKEAIKFFVREILHSRLDIDIKLSKQPHKLPLVLSKDEILLIIDNVSHPKHKLMLSLSYGCGFRVSEIVSLRVSDINLDDLTIIIRGAK